MGKTLSCGCLRNDRVRETIGSKLSGQTFGYLTVIEQADSIIEDSGTVRTAWKCKCRCGNEITVKTINLKAGNTKSCGCVHSHGETKIESILREQGVDYAQQYVFKDLLSEKGGHLKFDFAIFDDGKLCYLIEFQGIQHYKPIDFFGGESQLEIQKNNDKLKVDYCKRNKIPLLIFTYQDMDIITYNLIKEKYYGAEEIFRHREI